MNVNLEKELDCGGAMEFDPCDCIIRYRDRHGNTENIWRPVHADYFSQCKQYFPEFRFLSLCSSHESSDLMNQKLVKLDETTGGLVEAALSWILEGWDLPFDSITPPMLAAALFNEAVSADDDVVRGISVESFPSQLRVTAYEILRIEGHEEKTE